MSRNRAPKFNGGAAADAAATVALTEITTELGSVVFYAVIMPLVNSNAVVVIDKEGSISTGQT
jgi:hypothetical protein